jgi:Protein of unknown function (DUF4241)
VPTGRIVACDPFYCVDAPAIVREVPLGRYPVLLALAQFARNGDERIASAMLRLRVAAPVRWEPAVWTRNSANASPDTDAEEEPTDMKTATDSTPIADAYCVDSGFGAFMDEAAIEALLDHIEAEDDDDYLQRRLDALGPAGGPERFNIPLDEETGANILLFTSGWGDGKYPSFWGFVADGDPICLLTDFGVVDDAGFL